MSPVLLYHLYEEPPELTEDCAIPYNKTDPVIIKQYVTCAQNRDVDGYRIHLE